MNKRYALIEDGIVANIVVATKDLSHMTDLLCIEVDDSVQVGYFYTNNVFIEPTE